MYVTIPDELVRVQSPPMADWLESYMSMRTHAFVRFGKWQECIDDPLPEERDRELYAMTTAMNHYGKSLANAALHRHHVAAEAMQLFMEAANSVPESRHLHVVKCQDILGVAREMVQGEVAYQRGDCDVAFEHLHRAVEAEDNLPYDEPWGWMMPSRHALGALL